MLTCTQTPVVPPLARIPSNSSVSSGSGAQLPPRIILPGLLGVPLSPSRELSPPGSLENSQKSMVSASDGVQDPALPLSSSGTLVAAPDKSPPIPTSSSGKGKFKPSKDKVDTFAYTNHSLLYEMSLAEAARTGTPRGSGMSTPRSGALTPRGTRIADSDHRPIRSSGSGVPAPSGGVGVGVGGTGTPSQQPPVSKHLTPENSARDRPDRTALSRDPSRGDVARERERTLPRYLYRDCLLTKLFLTLFFFFPFF